MAKNINMTRERKIALPVVIEAAQAYCRGLPESDKRRAGLVKALEAFRCDR